VSVREEVKPEVAGSVEDRPIQAPSAPLVDAQCCRSVGISSIGLDEPSAATFLGGAVTPVRSSKPMGLQL